MKESSHEWMNTTKNIISGTRHYLSRKIKVLETKDQQVAILYWKSVFLDFKIDYF